LPDALDVNLRRFQAGVVVERTQLRIARSWCRERFLFEVDVHAERGTASDPKLAEPA